MKTLGAEVGAVEVKLECASPGEVLGSEGESGIVSSNGISGGNFSGKLEG